MTTKQAKIVLHNADRLFVLTALSYVNLTDVEFKTLSIRHMRGHTQEYTAEKMDCSVNSVQNWEKSALDKCCEVWDRISFIKKIAAQ